MNKGPWVSVYILIGFIFILAGIMSDTWFARLVFVLLGMSTLLAGVIHSHAGSGRDVGRRE